MNFALYIPYIIVMVTYDILEWMGSNKSALLKPFLMPTLIIGYAAMRAEYDVLIVLGLLFGFIGDVALMIPSKDPRQLPLLTGIGAFLLGHVMYGIWCVRAIPQINPLGFLYAFALVAVGVMLFNYLKAGFGNMKLPVVAYEIIILSMSLCAFLLLSSKPNSGTALVWIGSVLFITSDSFLAERLFLHPRAHSGFLVSVTYTAAQLLIAIGSSIAG